jgi:hypothetical protein
MIKMERGGYGDAHLIRLIPSCGIGRRPNLNCRSTGASCAAPAQLAHLTGSATFTAPAPGGRSEDIPLDRLTRLRVVRSYGVRMG